MYCDRSNLLGVSKTTIFLMNTILIFFNNQITNYSGRKSALLLVCLFGLVIIVSPFIDILLVKVITFGIAYGSINSIDGLLPPVITEATDIFSRIPEVVLSISYIINAMAIVLLNFSLLYVSFGTNFIFICCFLFTIFGLFPWVFMMAESPVYLFRKGCVFSLAKSLHRIARINMRKISKSQIFEDIIGKELSEKLKEEKNVRILVKHLEEDSEQEHR